MDFRCFSYDFSLGSLNMEFLRGESWDRHFDTWSKTSPLEEVSHAKHLDNRYLNVVNIRLIMVDIND